MTLPEQEAGADEETGADLQWAVVVEDAEAGDEDGVDPEEAAEEDLGDDADLFSLSCLLRFFTGCCLLGKIPVCPLLSTLCGWRHPLTTAKCVKFDTQWLICVFLDWGPVLRSGAVFNKLAFYLDKYLRQFLILPTEAKLNKLAIYLDEYLRQFLL